jgi:hypothetical protein
MAANSDMKKASAPHSSVEALNFGIEAIVRFPFQTRDCSISPLRMPIVSYMAKERWTRDKVRSYCRTKGWRIVVVKEAANHSNKITAKKREYRNYSVYDIKILHRASAPARLAMKSRRRIGHPSSRCIESLSQLTQGNGYVEDCPWAVCCGACRRFLARPGAAGRQVSGWSVTLCGGHDALGVPDRTVRRDISGIDKQGFAGGRTEQHGVTAFNVDAEQHRSGELRCVRPVGRLRV